MEEVLTLRERIDVNAVSPQPIELATCTFGGFASPLYLADRGILGIRGQAGLWVQAFRRGWPITPPELVEEGSGDVSLLVAAALGEYFDRFPLTRTAVEGAVPCGARSATEIAWYDVAELVPQCGSGICLARPGDIKVLLQ